MDVFFPMAGQGARFGNRFKPFLTVGSSTFIEAAVAPFREFMADITRFVFVYLESQEREFNVDARLRDFFPDLPFETVKLARPTRGPAETIGNAIVQLRATGQAFICDCDHSLDVAPLFKEARHGSAAAIVPVWPLDGEDVKSWSVARVENGIVRSIAEKRVPTNGVGTPMGVIGCYGFRDVDTVAMRVDSLHAINFSDVIAEMLAERTLVRAETITRATFFGDPQRLANAERSQ